MKMKLTRWVRTGGWCLDKAKTIKKDLGDYNDNATGIFEDQRPLPPG